MNTTENLPVHNAQLEIPPGFLGQRLDQVLATLLPQYSRSRITQWIREGQILLAQQPVKPKYRVHGHEKIQLCIEDEAPASEKWQAQNIALDIIHEDDSLIIVNKPAGMVVHPAPGNYQDTLLNALLYHCPALENLPRGGIIHRLDKDTSGLLVIAKNLQAHHHLTQQLQQRQFMREYRALVYGQVSGGGTIDTAYGRDPRNRLKMAVLPHVDWDNDAYETNHTVKKQPKRAITHYQIVRRFVVHTLLAVKLETGRTHQIRVHMAHQRLPLVGDPVYGHRLQLPPKSSPALQQALQTFKRQALHACKLGFIHPQSGQQVCWQQDMPADMQNLLDLLQQHSEQF